jgi:hypothetical protein
MRARSTRSDSLLFSIVKPRDLGRRDFCFPSPWPAECSIVAVRDEAALLKDADGFGVVDR